MAKNLATSKGYDITEFVLGKDITKEAFFELLPNIRSVPQIFVNDVYVGGFEGFKEYVK
jgi:glutaredoxin